jgi:hypothetical protein
VMPSVDKNNCILLSVLSLVGGGGLLGLHLCGICLLFRMRSMIKVCSLKRRNCELFRKVRCDYREVLGYIVLHEADVSGISRAFALLVHLVLVAVEVLGGGFGGFLCLILSGESLRRLKWSF